MKKNRITIAKRFTFDAAHRLDRLPPEHKCNGVHGHTYSVEIVLSGKVDSDTGFIVDYDCINEAWKKIAHQVDHKYLNDVEGLEVPSTEILVEWIAERIMDDDSIGHLVSRVRVYESSTTWCEIEV